MKTKMVRVGGNGHGYKKARYWNMASFQPRKCREAAAKPPASAPSPLPGSASATESTDQNNPPLPRVVPAPPPTAPPDLRSRHCPGPFLEITKPALGTPLSAMEPSRDLCDPPANPPSPRNFQSEISHPESRSSMCELRAASVNSNPPAQPATSNPTRETSSFRTRTGKIARLPLDLREEVNEMLRRGQTYQEIALKLAEHGIGDINASNISNWKHGGYVDWLREQQETERSIMLPFALERCTRNIQLDRLQQNALIIATGQLSQIINRFDVERALDVLHEKPELLPSFISSLTSVGRCGADLAKTFELVHTREQTVRDQLDSSPCSSRGHETHFELVSQSASNGEPSLCTEHQTESPDRDPSRIAALDRAQALKIQGSNLESPKDQPLKAPIPDDSFKVNKGN